MAWDTTLVTQLRLVIGDIDSSNYDWTNGQLQQFIVISGIAVSSEVDLEITFIFDTDTPSISPDPVTEITDQGISLMFVFKAACLIGSSELRKDTSKFGIKVKDHLTSYDGTEGMKNKWNSVKNFCDLYKQLRDDWQEGVRGAALYGRAIYGPYTSFTAQEFQDGHLLNWGGEIDDYGGNREG